MSSIQPRVVLNLVAGYSSLGTWQFVWGTPVAPFSVGSLGEWAIRAAGVDEKHLFLAFDGYRLHVAAASPAQRVSVGGIPVGAAWQHVMVPSAIVFGAASITVACEDAARGADASARPRPLTPRARADRQPAALVDLSRTLQLRTVRLEVSSGMLAELSTAVTPEPVKPPVDLANTLYDGGALREHAAQMAMIQENEDAAPCAQSAPILELPMQPSVFARPIAAFRRSSLPKKLTIALLPLAIAGVCGMRAPAAPRPGPPVATAREKPRSATVDALPMQPASARPPAVLAPRLVSAEPAAVEVQVQPSDPDERLALIAAFSGNEAEAAALYERLATTRSSPTFALAARLAREDRVRKP